MSGTSAIPSSPSAASTRSSSATTARRADEEEAAAAAEPPPPSELDARVQSLVNLVCDRGMYESQMREIGFDASRQPLGKLQRETLRQGYACLQQIAQILEGRPRAAAAAATSAGGGGDARCAR